MFSLFDVDAMKEYSDAHTVTHEGITKQQLQKILQGLSPSCGFTCTCRTLIGHTIGAVTWDAAQPGYSKVHMDVVQLLPELAAALREKCHQYAAMYATLTFYNWFIVSPLSIKLSSSNPSLAAAARAEALQAVLAASRSGLTAHLLSTVQDMNQGLDRLMVAFHQAQTYGASKVGLKMRLQTLGQIRDVIKQSMSGVLPDIQLLCCWVTALARIWPGSMLAARGGGVSMLAADTLHLCSRYLEVLNLIQRFNQLLHQQQQKQQQQQHAMLSFPADDITAAVLHTAMLLVGDLAEHIAQDKADVQQHQHHQQQQQQMQMQYKQPQAVRDLLSQVDVLQNVAFPLVAMYGNQLLLNLQAQLKLEQQLAGLLAQQAAAAAAAGSSSGTGGPCSSSSGGGCCCWGGHCSSSSGGRSPAEVAEGHLLCRADWLQSQQQQQSQHQQQLADNPEVVQAWQLHFHSSWGDMFPLHLLHTVPEAIETAVNTSVAKSAVRGHGYRCLLPDHCWAEPASAAAAAADIAGSSGSRSSGSSNRPRGRGNSGSSSSSTSGMSPMPAASLRVVAAAAEVLRVRLLMDSSKQQAQSCQGCQLSNSAAIARVPLLLLSSAVAVRRLAQAGTVPPKAAASAAHDCSLAAAEMCVFFVTSCNSKRDWDRAEPCKACVEVLRPLVWQMLGLTSLYTQQVVYAADDLVAAQGAAAAAAAVPVSGACTVVSQAAAGISAAAAAPADAAAASASAVQAPSSTAQQPAAGTTTVSALQPAGEMLGMLRSALDELQDMLTFASLLDGRPPGASPSQQQLQQLSFAVQVTEAAARCYARMEQHWADVAGIPYQVNMRLGPNQILRACFRVVATAVTVASSPAQGAATAAAAAVEWQQVLQACMSLCLTLVSTASGKRSAAVPAVFEECLQLLQAAVSYVKAQQAPAAESYQQQQQQQQATAAADAAVLQQQDQQPPAVAGQQQQLEQAPACATAANVQLLAAACFLLGRYLLQMSEQLQLCLSHPQHHTVLQWVTSSLQLTEGEESVQDGRTAASEFGRLFESAETLSELLRECHDSVCFAIASMMLGQHAVELAAASGASGSSSSSSSSRGGLAKLINSCPDDMFGLGGDTLFNRMLDLVREDSGQAGMPEWLCHMLYSRRFGSHIVAAADALSQLTEGKSAAKRTLLLSSTFEVLLGQQQQQQPQRRRRRQQQQQPPYNAEVREALRSLISAFSTAGGALCAALPNRYFCNNPQCRNAAGASAGFSLVRGKGCVCGGCVRLQSAGSEVPQEVAAARYCSVDCQRQHWSCHWQCFHINMVLYSQQTQPGAGSSGKQDVSRGDKGAAAAAATSGQMCCCCGSVV